MYTVQVPIGTGLLVKGLHLNSSEYCLPLQKSKLFNSMPNIIYTGDASTCPSSVCQEWCQPHFEKGHVL